MAKEKPTYSIESADDREIKERDPEVPIIDIVRHGPTDYKELSDPTFIFDPQAPDFQLDAEHLDITEEGIEVIRETAVQLESKIDKDKEIVLIISSPNFRAHSTALVLEEYLRAHGVVMFNNEKEIRTARSLKQITVQNPEDREPWITADRAFRREDKRHQKIPPEEAHAAIAARLGKTISEIFTEDHQEVGQRFHRFLRHMNNIDDYFSDETRKQLEGKRLRIIAVTHEEVPSGFMRQALDTKENLKRGQILEIVPGVKLGEDDEAVTEVVLYPKGEESESETKTIVRKFGKEKSGA